MKLKLIKCESLIIKLNFESSLSILCDFHCSRECFKCPLPYILNNIKFLLLVIILHTQNTLNFVADCQIFNPFTISSWIFNYLLMRLFDILLLAQFQVIEPALGLNTLLRNIFSRMILNNIAFLWNVLS